MASRDALWASGYDESVEVNQRALIDKVLARYSAEFTVFRELLQNSDDAKSSVVEIHFRTKSFLEDRPTKETGTVESGTNEVVRPSPGKLPDLKTIVVHQWLFKNNGQFFREADWSRLKKIAEGNPDEETIGAFGVGFYSLFSVTDDPLVKSGDKWMGFYWKDGKDQLYARRGSLGEENPWTTFEMNLREPDHIPSAFDFTRFLASSITFMENLNEVSVYLDDRRLARLVKNIGPQKSLALPTKLRPFGGSKMMVVKSLSSRVIHIQAEIMRWVYFVPTEHRKPAALQPKPKTAPSGLGGFLSGSLGNFFSHSPRRATTPLPELTPPPPEVDRTEVIPSSITLAVYTANAITSLTTKQSMELERSMKKKPPQELKYKLIYTGKDAYDASVKEDEASSAKNIFEGLRADLDGTGGGHIFIGHATAQTTGIGGHMAARFIPTVERENIDLVDRNVAVWNKELLFIGGYLSRAAYELELETIRQEWDMASANSTKSPDAEVQAWLHGRALHIAQFFSFHPSTPSSDVSGLLETAFFDCAINKRAFSVLCSVGVRNIEDVRLPDTKLSTFIQGIPVLSGDFMQGAKTMVAALHLRRMIRGINFDDVITALDKCSLSEKELVAMVKWWISIMKDDKEGPSKELLDRRTQLMDSVVATIGERDHGSGRLIRLSQIETVIVPARAGAIIPKSSPTPDTALPISLSRALPPEDLLMAFGWREFTVPDWIRFITSDVLVANEVQFDIRVSPHWAERVIRESLFRAWPGISTPIRVEIAEHLKPLTCIPTSLGMRKPADAYLPNASIFPDLPVVTFPSGTIVKDKSPLANFLHDGLGVRKHVELEIIFSRMVKTGSWTVPDLIKYLVSVQSSLTSEELERLRQTRAFEAEGRHGKDDEKLTRLKARELYAPQDDLRSLGLPILDWGQTKWRPYSEEAKFVTGLGLRRHPPLQDLLTIAAGTDASNREAAMKYFIDHLSTLYESYDPHDFSSVKFLPALQNRKHIMVSPMEVYGRREWEALGFAVLSEINLGLSVKLKLRENPTPSTLIEYLGKTFRPANKAQATKIFELLASQNFTASEATRLSQLPFVPIFATDEMKQISPTQCYLGGRESPVSHSNMFIFVDFGDLANSFLRRCGTKDEPSVDQIAALILSDPVRFRENAGSRQAYQSELQNIAVRFRELSAGTKTRMKSQPFLLALRKIRLSTNAKPEDDANLDNDSSWEDDLKKPNDIVIADSAIAYRVFADSVWAAPEDDLLEGLYLELGSRRLSSLVREDYESWGEYSETSIASHTRSLILERLPLFIHESTHLQMVVESNWLNKPQNFKVKQFERLAKTLSVSYGTTPPVSQGTSAIAKRQTQGGSIELWISKPLDMIEVSTEICRRILKTPKKNDVLLFFVLLTTDLRALERQGYNVSRIRKAVLKEREARPAESARSKPTPTLPPALAGSQPSNVSSTSMKALRTTPELPNKASRSTVDQTAEDGADIQRSQGGMFAKGLNKLTKASQRVLEKNQNRELRGTTSSGHQGQGSQGVTPQAQIAQNIYAAVNACATEGDKVLETRDQMEMVKEALDDGYCDATYGIKLQQCAQAGDVKIYVSPDVPDREALVMSKADTIERFLTVIRPLLSVYKLPPGSVQIFYDIDGPMIAFNRSASLYLNLRYYEHWHDEQVKQAHLNRAYISWYFTLAHEIAHNLVKQHNSEHEFYMSAACQQYLVPLLELLRQ